jgi:hypothetical protein
VPATDHGDRLDPVLAGLVGRPVPGICVAFVSRGRLSRVRAAGVAEVGGARPVTVRVLTMGHATSYRHERLAAALP